MSHPTVAVIIVAAGSGTRLGAGVPKAFADVAGRPMLDRAIDGALGMSAANPQVIVVLPESHAHYRRDGVTTVVGASSRQGSVAEGLAVLEDSVSVVLVHDAARALTPSRQFDAVRDAVVASGHGIVPGRPVTDTIKRVAGTRVIDTIDRSLLSAMQTPQGFPRAELVAAYAAADAEFTDDAALIAAHGVAVDLVDGHPLAFKITTPDDLNRAEALVGETSRRIPDIRTGVGMDVHAYDDSAPLWLGGLYWPDEAGLKGHSDGDALSHAICDALLSAAGLGDIGGHFGTSDPRFAGAHGEVFITETVAIVSGAGFAVGNVSVQVVANRPRLGARRAELEAHLTELVGAPVSVSATTTDGLGFTGRGEGIAAIATALVYAQ